MTGNWSQYVENTSRNNTKLHFFPNPEGGAIALCTKAILSMTERKGRFSDPKNYHEKKTCKNCVNIIKFIKKIYPDQLNKEAPKEIWANIQTKYKDKPTAHYFINDITKSLCGSHKDFTATDRAEIKFSIIQEKFENKCKVCEQAIEFYLEYGKTKTESKEEKNPNWSPYIPPTSDQKRFKRSESPLVWIRERCTNVEKNGKQCSNSGVYPTGDPEAAKQNEHPCLKHNLRVKLFLSQSKKEVLA